MDSVSNSDFSTTEQQLKDFGLYVLNVLKDIIDPNLSIIKYKDKDNDNTIIYKIDNIEQDVTLKIGYDDQNKLLIDLNFEYKQRSLFIFSVFYEIVKDDPVYSVYFVINDRGYYKNIIYRVRFEEELNGFYIIPRRYYDGMERILPFSFDNLVKSFNYVKDNTTQVFLQLLAI